MTEQKQKIMIACPCYGSKIYTQCTSSLLKLQRHVDFVFETITFESLIPRARNALVAKFLSSDCDTLLFLDADIAFEPKDVIKLLESDKLVVCGMYPKKKLETSIIKNNLLEGKEDILTNGSKLAINIHPEAKVTEQELLLLDAPTGFMCIKREVFTKLISSNQIESYKNDIKGYPFQDIYNFFCVGVLDHRYLSEDYWFCRLCQKNDIPVYGNVKVILKHIGTYVYT